MLETFLRPIYQRYLVDPVAYAIAKYFPHSANCWTLLSCLVGIAVLPALLFKHNDIAIFLLLLSGYLDTLDGTVARLSDESTVIGSVFDIFGDRVVEFSVILGLFLIDPVDRGLTAILMLGSILLCITAFLVVGIFSPKDGEKSFFYSPGLIERAEAFIFFIAMILFPGYFNLLAFIFIFLVFMTAFFHLYQFYRQSNL